MTPREFFARLAASFGRGPRDADLHDELAFLREQLEQAFVRSGLAPDDARRAAYLELRASAGSADAWQDQRSLPALDMLVQDVRYGLRVLRRSPGFTVAALLTLALGIGANTAIFSILNAVLLRPLPYTNPDRLVSVGERTPDGLTERVGFATVVDWQARSRAFESFALMRSWMPTLVANGTAERIAAVRVTWNYFDMLGVRPALGRLFEKDEDAPDRWHEVVLSDGLWRRQFGADPSVVGRSITMNDVVFRIVGVLPPTYRPLNEERF
ncbi:MAG TPA: ABC transporter permease, partial [Vicinamibacterales bacterium]|nr:ABC transporter permease [Vicinamibacterales bacterium]